MRLLPPEDRAGWRSLRAELGVSRALRTAIEIRVRMLRGEPFAALPPALDAKERASRAQVAGAVLLFRSVRSFETPERARSVTARVVREAALAFLEQQIGRFGPSDLVDLSPGERHDRVRERLDRFPNVTATVDEASPRSVRFTVHACRLVELVREVGHPELAGLFCAADAHFFGTSRPGLTLDRPTTLALGHPACAFHIQSGVSP